MTIRVLVVEDDKIAAEAHASYVAQTSGFEVGGVARSAQEAIRLLRADAGIDLVLLDMNLPDAHGLTVLQQLRASGRPCDVIAVTAAREVDLVRQAATQGVVAYVLKPFTFNTFRTKLQQYADYRRKFEDASPQGIGQGDIDQLIGAMRTNTVRLPKGMSAETMDEVVRALRTGGVHTAGDVAAAIGASRVTARRYLEFLADSGRLTRRVRYGSRGRPEIL